MTKKYRFLLAALFVPAALLAGLAACGGTRSDAPSASAALPVESASTSVSTSVSTSAAVPSRAPSAAPAPRYDSPPRVAELSPSPPISSAPGAVTIENCLVSLIDEAQVPAQEPGVLKELMVREGDSVQAKQDMALIDDTKTKMEVRVAGAKLEAARAKAEDNINIRYAQASAEVAKAELRVNLQANQRVPGTVTETELDRLRLKVTESLLAIDKAKLEQRIAAEDANVAQAELDAANENINRRHIRAPFDGVVVDRRRHVGEWVQPGDVVFHIVRMDRLWVEAYLDAKLFDPNQVRARPARVVVDLAGGGTKTLEGKVFFVSPMVIGGSKFLVRAEVENQKNASGFWALSPGLTAKMTIQLQ